MDNGGTCKELAVPPRPKTELALPYGTYRLVLADGTPVERKDKHPFCMSRVFYDSSERPQEVWAEMSDGSCRWRQTASEVKVIVLKAFLPTLSPFSVPSTATPNPLSCSNFALLLTYMRPIALPFPPP